MDQRLRPMVNLLLIPTVIGILWFYARVRAHPMERRLVEADAAMFTLVPASETDKPGGRKNGPDDQAARDLDEAYADDLAFADMLAHTSAEADAIP